MLINLNSFLVRSIYKHWYICVFIHWYILYVLIIWFLWTWIHNWPSWAFQLIGRKSANQIEIDFATARAEIYATVFPDDIALGNGVFLYSNQNHFIIHLITQRNQIKCDITAISFEKSTESLWKLNIYPFFPLFHSLFLVQLDQRELLQPIPTCTCIYVCAYIPTIYICMCTYIYAW